MSTVRHYDAATAPRGILRHLPPITGYPALMWQNRYLIHNFFRRELLGRFRGTLLGVFWVLVHPIFMFAVYYVVFGMLFSSRWQVGQPPDPQFAIYLFSGIIVFQALNEGTTGSCNVVVENGNLVKKVAFPSEVLPVHVALVSLVLYGVGAVVCMIAGLAFGQLHPGPLLLCLPLVLLVQFVLTLGMGLFLANLQVFSRDVMHLWRILSMAWLFLSPVFWFPSRLAKLGELAELWFAVNPAYPLIMAHRIALGGVHPELGDFWRHLGMASVWALVFLILGYGVFTSRRHKFADMV